MKVDAKRVKHLHRVIDMVIMRSEEAGIVPVAVAVAVCGVPELVFRNTKAGSEFGNTQTMVEGGNFGAELPCEDAKELMYALLLRGLEVVAMSNPIKEEGVDDEPVD